MDMAFSLNDNFAEEDIVQEEVCDAPQGNCRRCNKTSALTCLRCGDCYCSKRCQDLEWPQHRYICFPKPPLVKINTVQNDGDIPEHGVVEPVHLKEQLRIMADVCREFMQQLEKTTDCKADNLKSHLMNGNTNFNTTSNFDDTLANDEKSFTNNNNTNNSNKPIKRNNYNNNKNKEKEQKPKSLIYCPANEKVKIRPPPPLIESDLSSLSSNKSDENIEDQIIYLTSFRSSNRVGVCPQKYENDGSYQKILDQIDNYGRTAKVIEEIPKPDTYALALRGGKYSRAKIMPQKDQINATRIRLDFVDYGNLAYRKLNELREITTELINLPIYTKIVQLTKVDLIVYDETFLRFLSGLERKYYKLKNVPGPPANSITVELFDLETGEKINEHISKYCGTIGKSTPSSSSTGGQTNKFNNKNRNVSVTKQKDDNESDVSSIRNRTLKNSNNSLIEKNDCKPEKLNETEPVLKAPFKENIFPLTTRNKKAVILDISLVEHGYIPCMFEEHKSDLNDIQIYLAKCEKSDMPYKPKHGEYVIALFEDDWYRGKVIGVLPNNKFEISYIDFLNEATLTSAEIRRYPEDLTIDCYATLCVISGLPKNISPEIREFLKTEISINDVIEINRVVEIADGRVAWIECHEIMDRMYEKNLI